MAQNIKKEWLGYGKDSLGVMDAKGERNLALTTFK